MKDFSKLTIASLLGAAITQGLAYRTPVAAATPPGRIEAKELVILTAAGKPAARILSHAGGAVLEFYDSSGKKAVELGFEEAQSARFLRLLDTDGRVIAGLNSSAPKGESTLYLGDSTLQTALIAGAIRSDVQGPTDDWGLQIRRGGAIGPIFSILTNRNRVADSWQANIRIVKQDGQAWTAPN